MHPGLLRFSFIFTLLTIFDIASTWYALTNGIGYEGNPIMKIMTRNLLLFSLFKTVGVITIIYMVNMTIKRNESLTKVGQNLILLIMLFVVGNNFIVIGSAVDNNIYSPSCINPSYDTGNIFDLTSNNASDGYMDSRSLTASGFLDQGGLRINGAVNMLCARGDPITPATIDSQARVWGTDELGNVFYTDDPLNNYSLGFFDPGFLGCSIDGNCNGLYKVASIAAEQYGKKIAFDTSGNVYIPSGTAIIKLIKDYGYSPQNFRVLVEGTDYPTTTGFSQYRILDIDLDASNNIYIMVGTRADSGIAGTRHLSVTILDSAGTLIKYDDLDSVTSAVSLDGFVKGGLIVDQTNPTSNYTYGYIKQVTTNSSFLKHNSSTGTTTVATLTGLDDVSDIGYFNNQIFVLEQNNNLMRSYTTNFQGFTQPGGLGAPAQITYDVSTVESIYSSYYNDSEIQMTYNIDIDLTIQPLLDPFIYKWKIGLVDPNGVEFLTSFTPSCTGTYTLGFVLTGCSVNGTATFEPPSGGWQNGTYNANLYEYNTETFQLAYLVTSSDFTVLNQSNPGGSVGSGQPPTTQPGSVIEENEIVLLLQNNTFWALILIIGLMLGIGALAGKSGYNPIIPMVMAGFLGLAVTTLINWIPAWVLFAVIIVVFVAFAWQAAKNVGA